MELVSGSAMPLHFDRCDDFCFTITGNCGACTGGLIAIANEEG